MGQCHLNNIHFYYYYFYYLCHRRAQRLSPMPIAPHLCLFYRTV